MKVHLVWHVRHAKFVDGSATEHFDETGDVLLSEEDGDDAKVLGIPRAADGARKRTQAARSEPGFKDEPDCFIVDTYELDKPEWVGGFITEVPG